MKSTSDKGSNQFKNARELNLAILRAIEKMNAPTASLGKIRNYFRQNKIPVKSRTGKIMNRDYINGLVREFFLEREVRNDSSGSPYDVYKLTPKAEQAIGKIEDNDLKSSRKTPSTKGKLNKKQIKAIEREITSEVEVTQVKKKAVKGKVEKEEKVDFEEYEKELVKCEKCGYMCHPDWDECPNCEELRGKRGKKEEAIEVFGLHEAAKIIKELLDCPACGYTCRIEWDACPICNKPLREGAKEKKSRVKKNVIASEKKKKKETIDKDISKERAQFRLPRKFCLSCGKKLPENNELDKCARCLFEEYMTDEGLFEEDTEKEVFNSFKIRLSNGKFSPDRFGKGDISFCPACGKKVIILRRSRFIKKNPHFCMNCYLPFYPPKEKHDKRSLDQLYKKAVKYDKCREILVIFPLQGLLLLLLLFTFINTEWDSIILTVYALAIIGILIFVRFKYNYVKKERIARDLHYRIKYSFLHSSFIQKSKYKKARPIKSNTIPINDLKKKLRIQYLSKYASCFLLTIGFLSYLNDATMGYIVLLIATFFTYPLVLRFESKLLDDIFRKGVHYDQKKYELYLIQLINQLKHYM